jgi:TusE/DsrC/DsvC family sulfur relay protein
MTVTDTHFDPDGFIKDPNAWNREVAQAIASREGIPRLGDDHWRVIDELRRHYFATGSVPVLRRICRDAGMEEHCISDLLTDPGRGTRPACDALPKRTAPACRATRGGTAARQCLEASVPFYPAGLPRRTGPDRGQRRCHRVPRRRIGASASGAEGAIRTAARELRKPVRSPGPVPHPRHYSPAPGGRLWVKNMECRFLVTGDASRKGEGSD